MRNGFRSSTSQALPFRFFDKRIKTNRFQNGNSENCTRVLPHEPASSSFNAKANACIFAYKMISQNEELIVLFSDAEMENNGMQQVIELLQLQIQLKKLEWQQSSSGKSIDKPTPDSIESATNPKDCDLAAQFKFYPRSDYKFALKHACTSSKGRRKPFQSQSCLSLEKKGKGPQPL